MDEHGPMRNTPDAMKIVVFTRLAKQWVSWVGHKEAAGREPLPDQGTEEDAKPMEVVPVSVKERVNPWTGDALCRESPDTLHIIPSGHARISIGHDH
jgi:hypothetical protein